jgi:hypothetical protein
MRRPAGTDRCIGRKHVTDVLKVIFSARTMNACGGSGGRDTVIYDLGTSHVRSPYPGKIRELPIA